MEIFQAKANKMKMRMSSKRFTTLIFVIVFVPFLFVLMVSSMYRNSNFAIFEGLSKGFPLGGRSNKTVSVVLPGIFQNCTRTAAEETTTKDSIASGVGSKNASFTITSSIYESTPHDKLIGGLLASGFDEESCISRTQSHLYRKASPHKPSPYLISKLRNYEEIHRRCGPNSRAYHKSMTKIQYSKNKGAATKCKYVIWTSANGLGNQMISIAATFLYAMLTDRVLLVKFQKDKQGLFCESFPNSTWILPDKFPFRFWNEEHISTYQTMATNSTELPSSLFINLQHSTSSDTDKFFHCDHSQDLLRKIPLLILRSDQYFVPSLFMNPFFNLEVTKMFPQKDTAFHHLSRYLFHPSNEAWEEITSYYQAHLAEVDERIGLQIRVFNAISTPQQAVMDLVLSCTLKHKILPEPEVDLGTSARKNQTVKAVLVASLHREYGENLRKMYKNNETVTGEVIKVYQPSHEEHQKFNDNKHNLKAWIDIYLLSLCDVLVTTSLSTFGYVAQGLGNLKPWLLYRLVNNETLHFPACERDFSSEPCYHVPPKHHCNGKPVKDFVSSFPYLRECKDYCFGVKLVNGSR